MDKSIVLQIVNGSLSTTAFCGAIVFIRYLWVNRHDRYEELRPAIAILVLWIGEMTLRHPTFVVRTMINNGYRIDPPDWAFILGGVVIQIAFLCMIRVFSPERWGYWSWLGTLLLSALVVFLSLVYVIWD